jgi:hypothetical protein
MGLGAGLGALGTTPALAAKSAKEWGFRFDDPIWNRDAWVRVQGDTKPGSQLYGYASGTVIGVREGERLRPLFGFRVFSAFRLVKQPDNSYQRLLRELVFYTDPQTGEILDSWDNPYTKERVRVVDVANDPFNVVFSEYYPDPPTYGGLNKEKPPRRPLILPWQMWPNDTVVLETDIHLYYPSALQPDKWPRESSGPMSRVSELFRYFMRAEDMANPKLTHVPHNGVWARVTPWLPWMLMGQEPGHILYQGMFTTAHDTSEIPENVLQRVKAKYPQYMNAPEKWVDPSLSSLENYARTEKPAPAKAP